MKQIIISLVSLLAISPATWSQTTLQAYRDSVYRASSELMNAQQSVYKAESAVRLKRIAMLPSLSASANFSKTFRHSGDNHLWGFSFVPQITQPIYGSGARAAMSQSQKLLSAAVFDNQNVLLSMRYAADAAYWNVSAMQLYMGATEEYVKIVKSLYNIVKQRFDEGYAPKSDLLQVEARLSDAEFSQIATSKNYQTAVNSYNNLLGVMDYQPVELAQSIVDSIPMPERVSVEQICGRHPDVLSQVMYLRAAEFGIKRVKATYNPKINAGVSGSWQTFTPNATNRTFLDAALTLGVNVPIFHWGARRHAIADARSDVEIASNNLTQIMEDVVMQEANAWNALSSSFSQMQSSLRNLAIAGENLSISTYSYNEGQATVLDVLQAQISWIQIYTNAITARFNYAMAVSEYQLVAGMEM